MGKQFLLFAGSRDGKTNACLLGCALRSAHKIYSNVLDSKESKGSVVNKVQKVLFERVLLFGVCIS